LDEQVRLGPARHRTLSHTEFEQAKRGLMKQIAHRGVGLALFLGLAGVLAGAQNQASQNSGSSLGDYARQIRKDPGVKTTPKVFDNDNLPREDKLSIVGPKAAPPEKSADNKAAETDTTPEGESKAATESKAGAEAKTGTEEKTEEKTSSTSAAKAPADDAMRQAAAKQWADKVAAQKSQIELLGRELNVLQREYQIRAAAMYADAGNRMRNSADWDKQDAQYKQQIADKQKALDDAKQQLDDLQEQARKAGAPPSVSEQ
jgi:hypothetical protein